jgi:hypothetical protein
VTAQVLVGEAHCVIVTQASHGRVTRPPLVSDRNVTPARIQRDFSGPSASVGEARELPISNSQARTTSTTVSACVRVSLRSSPRETSVVRRIWTRSGDDDPGSAQARMISSPVRVLGHSSL